MSSRTTKETQVKLKDFTNWQLEEDLEGMYDSFGLDEKGNPISEQEKFEIKVRKRARELGEELARIREKNIVRWGKSNDGKLQDKTKDL